MAPVPTVLARHRALRAVSIPTNTQESDPSRRVADFLIDCEEDRPLRAVLVRVGETERSDPS